MKPVKKRLFAILSFVLALVFAAGCASTPADSSTSDGNDNNPPATDTPASNDTNDSPPNDAPTSADPVTITYWHTYGDAEDEFFNNSVLPLFNSQHPEITVEAVRQDGGGLHQMIVMAFGSGQVPDVARVDITNTAAYAAQGGIIAMESLPGFDALKDSVLSGPLSTNLYRGSYYGLPLDTNCKAAVMNMNIMNDLGLSEPPATMEAFIDAVKANGDGQYKLNVSGVGGWDLYPYFWLFGGVLTDEGYTKASGYLDSAASVAAIEKMIELNQDKVFTIRDVDGTVDAWDGIKSEYAMFFEGPWYFGSNRDFSEDNIVPATIPTYNGKSASVVGGENIVIFEQSNQKDAAWVFTQFLLSEEVQLMMLSVGQIPVIKSAIESDSVTNDPVWSVYLKQLESAQARIPSPQDSAIGQIWSDAMMAIFSEGADVTATLQSAAAQIDSELSK